MKSQSKYILKFQIEICVKKFYIIRGQKYILYMYRYYYYIKHIKDLETEYTESYVIIEIDILRRQILMHCRDWILKFSQLLLKETNELLDRFYKYLNSNSAR